MNAELHRGDYRGPVFLRDFITRLNTVQKLVFGLLLLCVAVLLIPVGSLSIYLMGIDHYQHFPLLVIGGAFLAFRYWKQQPLEFVGELTPRVTLWLVVGVCLTAGVFVIPSRWMASIAMFTLIVAAIYFWGGPKLARLWFGPLCLLAAAIPLPAGLGTNFVVWLQQVATTTASLWLEFFNIAHHVTGVSIQTGEYDYLVKEACSGINSVYAAVALGVTYAVLRHYSLWRLALLVGQLIVWVIVANATRVFVMVAMKEKFGVDLIDSALHEVVGGLTFLLGIALAFSGDHVVRYLVPLRSMTHADWIASFQVEHAPKWYDRSVSARFGQGFVGGLACASILGVLVLYRYESPQQQSRSIQDLVSECCIDFDEVDEAFLPEELGDWKRFRFDRVEREEDSVFGGMVSFQWQYGHPSGRSTVIQIDGPYTSWHDLTVCYRGAGWNIAEVETLKTDETDPGKTTFASEILLTKGGLDHGHSIFYCIDQEVRNVEPLAYVTADRSLNGVFGRLQSVFKEHRRIAGGAIQLQMFDSKPGQIDSSERNENRELFWMAVTALQSKLASLEESSGASDAESRGREEAGV